LARYIILKELKEMQPKFGNIYIKVLKEMLPKFGNIYKIYSLFKNYKFFYIFWAKYFGNFKNGQKKCPKIENPKTVLQKKHFCDHN